MGVFIFNACPKCDGPMRFNVDRDLDCFICGKVVYLVGGFNDSRTGERRYNKTEKIGAELDKSSQTSRSRIWSDSTPDNSSTMARQGGLFRLR